MFARAQEMWMSQAESERMWVMEKIDRINPHIAAADKHNSTRTKGMRTVAMNVQNVEMHVQHGRSRNSCAAKGSPKLLDMDETTLNQPQAATIPVNTHCLGN